MTPLEIVIIVLVSLLALALIAFCAFLWMIKPGTRKCGMERFTQVRYAHRGLHDGGRPENSLSAFRAAKSAGYGIELDVRLSKDGKLVVFHDPTLHRVCGVEGRVIDYTAEELSTMRLAGTSEGIPTFKQVLELIDGAIPMLIEIKMEPGESGVAEKLAEEIKDYHGDYIVESFNPMALRIMKKLMPSVPRGILSMRYADDEKFRGKPLYFLLENLVFNFLMRPDFIAYEKGRSKNKILRFIRKTWRTPLFAWTVRSEDEEARAISDGYDTIIFERYLAKK